jgi:hypothetical protein
VIGTLFLVTVCCNRMVIDSEFVCIVINPCSDALHWMPGPVLMIHSISTELVMSVTSISNYQPNDDV